MYNLTHLAQANSTLEYLQATTDTLPWFPILLAVSMFAVFLLALKSENFPVIFMVSGFFVTTITGMLWLAGYMPFLVFVFMMVITTIATLASTFHASS